MNEEYILIRTYLKDIDKTNRLLNILLNKKLVSGGRIYKTLSKYYENGRFIVDEKYTLEVETKKNKYDIIERTIENFDEGEKPKIFSLDINNFNYNYKYYIEDAVR